MKTTVLSYKEPERPEGYPCLKEYVNSDASGSLGEIALFTSPTTAIVLHSVSSGYPVGHTYETPSVPPAFFEKDQWKRLDHPVTITFER